MSEKSIFNISPSEDDDDDDDDERQELIEALQDQEDYNKNKKPMTSTNPFATGTSAINPNPAPFYGSGLSGTSGYGYPRSSWSPQVNPYSGGGTYQPSFGNPYSGGGLGNNNSKLGTFQYNPIRPATGFGGGYSPYSQPTGTALDRSKRVIFAELMDVLVESYTPGCDPRGAYDLHTKFDVFDKISCFGPSYIFIITNQDIRCDKDLTYWQTICNYYALSLADYCKISRDRCIPFIGPSGNPDNPFTKPNPGLFMSAVETVFGKDWKKQYPLSSMIMIGKNSGGRGQSDSDFRAAERFGIDYLPIENLLTGC